MLLFIDKTHIITGAAQPQITRQTLSPLLICYPSINEQRIIVSHLNNLFDRISKSEELLQNALADNCVLKQALLRQIFE